MARVKHAFRGPVTGTTRLPRAVFGVEVNPKKTNCAICGLCLLKTNLRRHIRSQHEGRKSEVPAVVPSTPPACVPLPTNMEKTCEVSTPYSTRSVGTVTSSPVSVCSTAPFTSPVERRLVVRIPKRRKVAEVITVCNQGQPPSPSVATLAEEAEEDVLRGRDWDVNPCIPNSDEELFAKLAKLYAGRVKMSGYKAKIPYRDTVTITNTARDQTKRDELKDVFRQVGQVLHTEEEFHRLLAEAEAKGRESASRPSADRPVFTVTSTHRDGEPQSILVNTGGAWGIKISAVAL